MQGPGKSWNRLGYDVGGGHNNAGADAKNSCVDNPKNVFSDDLFAISQ